MMAQVNATLPNGSIYVLSKAYTMADVQGVSVLVVASVFSLVAVLSLLSAIALSAFNTRNSAIDQHLFVRTHVAAYFISLLISDLIQAVGSILNGKWIHDMLVVDGDFCTFQAVLKQTADVAVAFWVLVIAIHTFCLLFLELKPGKFALYGTLISGWFGIATIVIAGPAATNVKLRGPFYGVSGYWCWIAPAHTASHVTLDYMFMFLSAFFSFILYTLIFLRLRGNIVVTGWRVAFRMTAVAYQGKQSDRHAVAIAKQMLLYPVAYTIIILPIAAARLSSFAGSDVPFAATIFCDTVYLLSGVVNVTLFTTTRKMLPLDSLRIPKWSISEPRAIPEYGSHVDSYYRSSGTYAKSDYEKESVTEEDIGPVVHASA
ncbi:hypothetical protein FB45DRAFT_893781 [Roridomyces roridus]|uniref:Glucose receptor Git3 N-terminal domain-containing protein n=1 Tax=Roridomyces roridus TaxID=1738132 RepID=A0AAD7CFP5_9AGAR|nr:hypothetical protein FB45DRAFT_893781 [Roridomyces roridus]